MPLWIPTEEWKDQEAFVIGGGSSLIGFDWEKLRGKNTIGCNEAFTLGPEIVQICIFGDGSWFYNRLPDLIHFPNRRVTNCPSLLRSKTPWLLQMKRLEHGFGTGEKLGWNYSTGAAALNLAVLLGAKTVYLLGFDACKVENKTHWHNKQKRPVTDSHYARFLRGFSKLSVAMKQQVPHVTVYNVNSGVSKMTVFENLDMPAFWQRVCPLQEAA